MSQLAQHILQQGRVGVAVRSTGVDPLHDRARLLAIALPGGETAVVDLFAGGLAPMLEALTRAQVVGHGLKLGLLHLRREYGLIPASVADTELAWQLIDGGEHAGDDQFFEVDRLRVAAERPPVATTPVADWSGALPPSAIGEARTEAVDVLAISEVLKVELARLDLVAAADQEFAFVNVVVDLELAGVLFDEPRWARIVGMSRNESIQLRDWLLRELQIKSVHNDGELLGALRRAGLKVDATSSEALAAYATHPVVKRLRNYRSLHGFVSGVGEGVLNALQRSKNARVHGSVRQLGAATGRISLRDPNLLGVPRSAPIRQCIRAPEGMVLIVADYATIELRVMADHVGESALIDVFRLPDGDPHRHTAAELLRIPADEVTEIDRRRAKAINFGFVFGMGARTFVNYALESFGVKLTLEEAQHFKEGFATAYPMLASWQKRMAREMPTELRTGIGRLRCFPSSDEDYCARLNAYAQGTAADGLKRALILLSPKLTPLGARVVLAIHDELLVEAPESDAAAVAKIVGECMREGMAAFVTHVPIKVEPMIRSSWAG